ncbi:hypothetical protein EVAR_71447_1, partial [Eumeta japonica]
MINPAAAAADVAPVVVVAVVVKAVAVAQQTRTIVALMFSLHVCLFVCYACVAVIVSLTKKAECASVRAFKCKLNNHNLAFQRQYPETSLPGAMAVKIVVEDEADDQVDAATKKQKTKRTNK